MLAGLALNTLGPTLGIQRPLSVMPLAPVMTALTLVVRDVVRSNSSRVHPYVIRVPRPALYSALLLRLLPLLKHLRSLSAKLFPGTSVADRASDHHRIARIDARLVHELLERYWAAITR